MSLTKRVLKHERTQSILSWLLAKYIQFVYITSKKTIHISPGAKPYMSGKENGIFAFWHGRMMMCPMIAPPGRKMNVLISFHRDGKLISAVIAHFGQSTIQGSSSKGGATAVKEILRALKKGENVSITPDGPRGPVHIAEMGTVTVAKLSGKPVIPVTFSTSHNKRLRSWDRFMLALPFGHIVFSVGEPIMVPRDVESEERIRLNIEQSMNLLIHKTDEITHA